MDRLAPPLPSQFRGRRLDFCCAVAFYVVFFVGLVSFATVRFRKLLEDANDIDEVKKDTLNISGGFRLPFLDICELSDWGGSLLEILGVTVTAKWRDPKNGTATKQQLLARNKTLTPSVGYLGVCKGQKDCNNPGYKCNRYDAAVMIPQHAEQVDGDFDVRVIHKLEEVKDGLKNARGRIGLDVDKKARLLPDRLYKKSGESELHMISGFFFRLSLAEDIGHPVAFEEEMMRHVGVPLDPGARIVDVLARAFHYTWQDTLGFPVVHDLLATWFNYSLPYKDTWILGVSQFTRFEPVPSQTGTPRVIVKFMLGTTTATRVEHINHLAENIMDFFKDCAALTIIFTAMNVLFTPAGLVQKRFYFNVFGLGRLRVPEDEGEEKPLLPKEYVPMSDTSEDDSVEEPRPSDESGSANKDTRKLDNRTGSVSNQQFESRRDSVSSQLLEGRRDSVPSQQLEGRKESVSSKQLEGRRDSVSSQQREGRKDSVSRQ